MTINENGFTERVGTPSVSDSKVENSTQGRSQKSSSASESGGDNVQLSGFAARINGGLSADATNRAQRVDQLAKAVNDKTFQVDSASVSSAIVSEGLRANG